MCYCKVWKKWRRKENGYKVFQEDRYGGIVSLFHRTGKTYKSHVWYDAEAGDAFSNFVGFGAFKTLEGAKRYVHWLASSGSKYKIHKVKLAHNIRSASVAINGVPRCILGNEMMVLERVHG